MPLATVSATHVRVSCDACRSASAEVCGRRELEVFARTEAVTKFRRAGWHNDTGRIKDDRRSDGSGRWYCPECAKRSHL